MLFKNRQHAGRLLAEKLINYQNLNPIVLALPRGGVPIASEIALALKAPLDVVIVRKVGHPLQRELAVGAICEDDEPIWAEHILARSGFEPDDLGQIIKQESDKIKRQTKLFRGGRKLPALMNRTAIVVDDGLATGATAVSAIKYLQKKGVAKIIMAVPIAAANSARRFRSKVSCSFVCLIEPDDFDSVGQWYNDFSQVSDEEVVALLKERQNKMEQYLN